MFTKNAVMSKACHIVFVMAFTLMTLGWPPLTEPRTAHAAPDLSHRYVIFLDGINSYSPDDTNGGAAKDFANIKNALLARGFNSSRFVNFSYAAARDHNGGDYYCSGWINGCATTGQLGSLADLNAIPNYDGADTHLKIEDQANALDWLLGQITRPDNDPSAQIDLVGFSLGGIVTSYWAARTSITSAYRSHIHAIALIDSPVGGFAVAGQVLACEPTPLAQGCLFLDAINLLALQSKFGQTMLCELQLSTSSDDCAYQSIVGELPDAALNFPGRITSIESTEDYLVNGRDIPIICDITCGTGIGQQVGMPFGKGTGDWAGIMQHSADLGGHGDAVAMPVLDAKTTDFGDNGLVYYNHMAPLCIHDNDPCDPRTAEWVLAALEASSPLPPTTAVSISSIQGNFFANSSEFNGTFDVAPAATPLFTEQFPVINFNPPYDQNPSIACGSSTAVNELSRPFEDVVQFQDGSCGEQIVQGNGYQAGIDSLSSFEAVFTAQLTVSQPGQVTFNLFSDDGWVLSIGPNGASQPAYVSGSMDNPPAKGPFTGYPVVGSFNTNSPPVQNTVTVKFPAAGTYPMELDYVECCQGELSLVMGTSFGNPIPPRIPPAPPCGQQLGQHCTAIWTDTSYYSVGDSGQVCYTVPQASYIVLTLYLPDGSSQRVYRASDDGMGACLPATIIMPMGDHRMHLDVYTDSSQSTRIDQADVSYAVGTIVAIVAAAAASGTPAPGTPQPSTPTPTDSTPSPGIILATLTPTATPVPPTSTPVPATQVPTTTSNPPAATNTPSSTTTGSASPAPGQGTPSTPVATGTQAVQTATSTTQGTSAATATATAGPDQNLSNSVAMPTATSTTTARQPVTHGHPTRSGTHPSGPALRVSMLPVPVQPGAPERIAVSYLQGALVQASVAFPGERPVSLVNMTDSHGHLTLTVPVPRNVRLRNGRASAPVSVRAVAGPWRRLTLRTVSVRPGAIQRITVSTVPRTLVRALVNFSRHQSLSLFGMTDNRGRMSLVVRVPRTIKLQNGQARVQVAVWTVTARRQAEATVLLTISDMVVSVDG